jgi:hypothetical protein
MHIGNWVIAWRVLENLSPGDLQAFTQLSREANILVQDYLSRNEIAFLDYWNYLYMQYIG